MSASNDELEALLKQAYLHIEQLTRNTVSIRILLRALMNERKDGADFLARTAAEWQAASLAMPFDDEMRKNVINGVLLIGRLPGIEDADSDLA